MARAAAPASFDAAPSASFDGGSAGFAASFDGGDAGFAASFDSSQDAAAAPAAAAPVATPFEEATTAAAAAQPDEDAMWAIDDAAAAKYTKLFGKLCAEVGGVDMLEKSPELLAVELATYIPFALCYFHARSRGDDYLVLFFVTFLGASVVDPVGARARFCCFFSLHNLLGRLVSPPPPPSPDPKVLLDFGKPPQLLAQPRQRTDV